VAEVDPDEARRAAREVLAEDRFRSRDVPRPLRGVLEWIGRRLQDAGDVVAELLSTPAGVAVSVTVVGVLGALVATATVRRRNRLVAVEAAERAESGPDPRALDEAATRAEAGADFAAAVRLRFRAGLIRLGRSGQVDAPDRATTGALVAEIDRPGFTDLAATFDAVAYGGRPASADDARAAREGWPRVLAGRDGGSP